MISEEEKILLDSPISKEEIDIALKQLKNNKSPGIDGYSAEFFKRFWPQLVFFSQIAYTNVMRTIH